MSSNTSVLTGALPRTAQEALALWDEGKPVPAFKVESEGASQDQIYGFAFELIRAHVTQQGDPVDSPTLNDRERGVAYSICQVALTKGWAKMLHQHIGEHIPAIVVQKPA
jgi:hypothetical protein